MKEKEIYFIRTIQRKKKDTGEIFYMVDYIDIAKDFEPKTDFISAVEFTEINKKMKDEHVVKCVGIFDINDRDKLYLSKIK